LVLLLACRVVLQACAGLLWALMLLLLLLQAITQLLLLLQLLLLHMLHLLFTLTVVLASVLSWLARVWCRRGLEGIQRIIFVVLLWYCHSCCCASNEPVIADDVNAPFQRTLVPAAAQMAVHK
jgi:O-antigen ligase